MSNSWQTLVFALVLTFFIHYAYADPLQADNTNKVEIVNPHVQPPIIKVGDTFSVTATLVNNSPNPIYWYGRCGEGVFSVIFDNHVTVIHKELMACAAMTVTFSLNPSEKITETFPDINFFDYRAAAVGSSNATVTVSYFVNNQTAISTTISKSFLFTIYGNKTGMKAINGTVLSPLKQLKNGILPTNIICNEDSELVFKNKDNSPACVKLETVNELVKRGWTSYKTIDSYINHARLMINHCGHFPLVQPVKRVHCADKLLEIKDFMINSTIEPQSKEKLQELFKEIDGNVLALKTLE